MQYTQDYVLIKHSTGTTRVVDNIDDILFFNGWRFVKYIPNSKIDWNQYWSDRNNYYDKVKAYEI